MENLKWEVDQKEREIRSLKQQLDLTEQQSKKELDGVQHLLQVSAVSRSRGRRSEPALHEAVDDHSHGPRYRGRQRAKCTSYRRTQCSHQAVLQTSLILERSPHSPMRPDPSATYGLGELCGMVPEWDLAKQSMRRSMRNVHSDKLLHKEICVQP